MGRSLCFAFTLVIFAALPLGAAAQEADPPSEAERELADAHYLRDVGAGLTLGGIATAGLGAGLMFGITGFENWGGIIAGGLFEGIGGLLALIGMPTWIAGGVRSDVLGHREEERADVGWSYELAGIVTTLAGVAICLVGGALAGSGMGLENTYPHDERALETMRSLGAFVFIPLGYFIATFIGTPMWAEGARF